MKMKNTAMALGAIAAGLSTMYIVDPNQGRRRRAVLRDKMRHAGRNTGDALSVVGRDLRNRAEGMLSIGRRMLRFEREVQPHRLEERARAILGRVVSHPHAIDIRASDGKVTVSGYILEREVAPLLDALRLVAGVHEVENHLEIGRNPSEMPSLQGGRSRPGIVPDVLQRRMSPASRMLIGAGALLLAGYGLQRRDTRGGLLATLGFLAGLRAATNRELRYLIGTGGPAAIRLQNSIEVNAPLEEVFDFFSHFENFPRFMHHIREVSKGEGEVWHWVADGPLGVGVSWDAVVTRFERNHRVSWKSLPGSAISNTGSAWFERTPDGGTRVHILMSYNPPAGALGHALSVLLGADPLRHMDEDLVRLKSLIERGKTSAHGMQVAKEDVAIR